MMNTAHIIVSGLATIEQLFIAIASAFFFGGLFFILFLFGSRIIKDLRLKTESRLQDIFQQPLNSLLITTATSEVSDISYQTHLQELTRIISKSKTTGRQVLINQLMKMKTNLSGASSKMLDKIYISLNLHLVSKNKLSSSSWKIKAQGIRELTKMNYHLPKRMLKLFGQTENQTLKEEIFMSSVSLNKKRPLGYLDQYDPTISLWNRINFHHHLSLYDPRQLPDFSNWFHCKREDIALFSISMVRQFRQLSATPALIQLLSDTNERIVATAIRALGDLETFDAIDNIMPLVDRHWGSKKISLAIVKFMAKIGRTNAQIEMVARYLRHEHYIVRFEAVRTMMNIGENGKKILLLHNRSLHGRLDQMIAHVSEPLLA